MTPSVSNATGSEREEGSAWREGLGILGDRCDLVIKREDDFFYLINTSSDLLAISGDRCLIQPCHQEVDQFDDHNKCDDLIKNQNTFTAISFNEGEMWPPELWTCEGGEADSQLGHQCCPVVFV